MTPRERLWDCVPFREWSVYDGFSFLLGFKVYFRLEILRSLTLLCVLFISGNSGVENIDMIF